RERGASGKEYPDDRGAETLSAVVGHQGGDAADSDKSVRLVDSYKERALAPLLRLEQPFPTDFEEYTLPGHFSIHFYLFDPLLLSAEHHKAPLFQFVTPTHAKVLQQLGWLYHQDGSSFQNQDATFHYPTKCSYSQALFSLLSLMLVLILTTQSAYHSRRTTRRLIYEQAPRHISRPGDRLLRTRGGLPETSKDDALMSPVKDAAIALGASNASPKHPLHPDPSEYARTLIIPRNRRSKPLEDILHFHAAKACGQVLGVIEISAGLLIRPQSTPVDSLRSRVPGTAIGPPEACANSVGQSMLVLGVIGVHRHARGPYGDEFDLTGRVWGDFTNADDRTRSERTGDVGMRPHRRVNAPRQRHQRDGQARESDRTRGGYVGRLSDRLLKRYADSAIEEGESMLVHDEVRYARGAPRRGDRSCIQDALSHLWAISAHGGPPFSPVPPGIVVLRPHSSIHADHTTRLSHKIPHLQRLNEVSRDPSSLVKAFDK
ncbi:hypothetical protein GGG16DRAFT_106989, partial [Schizophyllum commune]